MELQMEAIADKMGNCKINQRCDTDVQLHGLLLVIQM